MKQINRLLSFVLALVLLMGCTLAGLALPAAAEGDTFALAEDEVYVAPTDSGGYVTYAVVPAVTPDGKPYEETLTWKSSSTLININASTGRFNASSSQKNATGTAVITATNAAGESHSCTVHVVFDGERIGGGDFESETLMATNRWTEILGKAQVVEDPDDPTNHVLKMPLSGGVYYKNASLNPSKTYMLSYDVKGELSGKTSEIQISYLGKVASGGAWKSAFPVKETWKHYSRVFTTKSTVDHSWTIALGNQNYTTGDNTNPIYFDNISLVELGTAESIALSAATVDMEIGDETTLSLTASPEGATMNRPTWATSNDQVVTVDKNGKITAVGVGSATITAKSGNLEAATCAVTVYEEMLAAVPNAGLTDGTITVANGAFGEVQPDDVVTVTATPKEGFVMVPGSLRYTMKDGTVVRVLNKDFEDGATFGQGDGNTFKFVMPNEKVTLTADFISTAEQNFAANTIGTACRFTVDGNGEKVYDGIRFLTRLNLANKFDAESNTLTVTYGGKEYTVLELGSLLKREQSTTKLTYENAVANQGSNGIDKMWVSKAYTSDSGVFKLVDYTESYIDFASVMLTKYYDRFYTASGYIRLQAADESIVTLEFDEISNSISTVVPILPPVQDLAGVTAEKEYWTPVAHTVEPGQNLKYTITVKAGATAGKVTVFEPIPENTVYVEGADRLVGKTAVWELELAANETKELTYTVQVKDSMDLCEGGTVVATDTQVGNTTVEADNTLYIERVVNEGDATYMNKAVQALADSSYGDLTYVYFMYYLTYSNGYTGYRTQQAYTGYKAADVLESVLNGDGTTTYTYKNSETDKNVEGSSNHLDNVAPTLYGGTSVKGQIEGVKGAPAAEVRESDLMIGDVLIVKNGGVVSLYIYCDKGLMQVKSTGGVEKADIAVLNTLTASQGYLVLRPRTGLKTTTSYDMGQEPEQLTDEQKAVINAAESFLMRGEKVQYADTSLAGNADYRWAKGLVSPEDATDISWKYTNCAAFCYDSYYYGLGYALGSGNMYTTQKMAENTSMRVFNMSRTVADSYTDEEKAALSKQWLDTLQPGDLMVVRRSSGSGHVMLYIGNGKMIHSSGANFRYTFSREIYEPSIRYGQVQDYFLNSSNLSGYLFGDSTKQSSTQVIQACILRPLSKFTGEVPENAINRQNNLQGVVAQKVASHTMATTVTAGDTITYTYKIRNTNDTAVTLSVTDIVPANTTYVSGAESNVDGALSWNVTVPANESREVSFTVKVNEDVATGTLIASKDGKVGGVKFTARDITVAPTLTAEQQQAVADATAALIADGTTLKGFELANKIYENALGIQNVFATTDAAVIGEDATDGVFADNPSSGPAFVLASSGKYRAMLAPTLWGGRGVDSNLWDQTRSRLPKQEQLIVGDVILRRTSSATTVYLYVGGNYLLNLTNSGTNDSYNITYRLECTMLATGNYFAVLRPSMTMGETA